MIVAAEMKVARAMLETSADLANPTYMRFTMVTLSSAAVGAQSRPAAPNPCIGFWPAEHVPELDDIYFEPNTPQHPGCFAVYSPYGRVLGRFDDRDSATTAMRNWPMAAYVLFAGREIVARKSDDGLSLERRAA